ncbi:MAG TPA: CTP synthase, partial [Treponema sp.]|nr:CTP synthase [Treponema sp.]
ICLGMQIMVIEFARNVLGIPDACSREFNEEGKNCVIDLMEGQKNVKKGGTMRLGAYPCSVKDGTKLKDAYGTDLISERHRHRYEFNNDYRTRMEEKGLTICGLSPDGNLVEAVELSDRRKSFFVGVQFHPEFKSRPDKAHPLFVGFLKAADEV